MTYIDQLASAIGTRCGMSMDNPRERQLLRFYALLGLTLRNSVTEEDVHDAWSAWRLEDRPEHPSIVPFDELSPEVQDLDIPYRDAIRAAIKTLPCPGCGEVPCVEDEEIDDEPFDYGKLPS